MFRVYSIFVSIFICVLLSSCALAPGHKMNAQKISNDGSFESSQVELIQITPDVIKDANEKKVAPTIPEALLDQPFEPYRIGASDTLFITVWNHPELTVPGTQYSGSDTNGRIVKPDGDLFYPYVGNIQAAGKTTEELRIELTKKLAKYIESPQVDVGVLRFSSQRVTLSGAFMNTAPIPVTNKPMSLIEAIGLGKADLVNADLSSLTINRAGQSYTLDVYALTSSPSRVNDIYLKDGDSVHLPFNDHNKVFIMGEVTRPQALPMKSSSITLTDAIGSSGGIHQMSSKGQDVYVIRGVKDLSKEKAKIYQLQARSPSAFILANNFALQAQDVIYIGASGVTRWNRVIAQLLPSISILSATSRAWYDTDRINE